MSRIIPAHPLLACTLAVALAAALGHCPAAGAQQVERDTQVLSQELAGRLDGFSYQEGQTSTLEFRGTPIALGAEGDASVKFEDGRSRIKASVKGLPAPDGRVPSSDICRYLSEFGLAVIVGHIEDDWLLARIMGFGVLLGKGALFGGAKLVKAEVVADRGSAAA